MMEKQQLPHGVELLKMPRIVDVRGALSFAQGGQQIPFDIRRVFWISDVPADGIRGRHAHWTCQEVIVPVAGSLEIEVDDGQTSIVIKLTRSDEGILIREGVWCELRCFAPGTVCVVMASEDYQEEGYVHDRQEWLRQLKVRDARWK